MSRHGKRYQECFKLIDKNKDYPLREAIEIIKKMPQTKFDESVELSFNLNIDAKKSEQMVRGTVVLPHGSGKSVRVVAICKGEKAKEAKEAGADYVGDADIITKIQGGWLDFEGVVTTPDMMKEVARLGKILGPRGMMPNPKADTLGEDVAKIIKGIKAGKVEFKIDKTGNIHEVIGKSSFSVEQICENAIVLIKAVADSRPVGVKGQLINTLIVSKSMSPSLRLTTTELTKS